MDYADLMNRYPTQTAAGEALKAIDGKGVAQSTVAGWKKSGIPELRQLQYDILWRGKTKVYRSYRREAA